LHGRSIRTAGGNARPAAGVLINAELDDRLHRLPDYGAEGEALHALARALTASRTAGKEIAQCR
jgi:hypothetical protein